MEIFVVNAFQIQALNRLYSKDAAWHVLPSSKGETADFLNHCREKCVVHGKLSPYENGTCRFRPVKITDYIYPLRLPAKSSSVRCCL